MSNFLKVIIGETARKNEKKENLYKHLEEWGLNKNDYSSKDIVNIVELITSQSRHSFIEFGNHLILLTLNSSNELLVRILSSNKYHNPTVIGINPDHLEDYYLDPRKNDIYRTVTFNFKENRSIVNFQFDLCNYDRNIFLNDYNEQINLKLWDLAIEVAYALKEKGLEISTNNFDTITQIVKETIDASSKTLMDDYRINLLALADSII